MEKLVIAEVNERGEIVKFFNGATFVESRDDAQIFDDKSKAKFYQGKVIQQFPEKEFQLVPVKVELSFNAPMQPVTELVVENA
jgi:hypothetical protein